MTFNEFLSNELANDDELRKEYDSVQKGMKLQYKFYESVFGKYRIWLYCDGWLVKSYNVWEDELDGELDKLEDKGYEYGYTEEEVKEAKERYEMMLKYAIIKKEEV